MPKEYRQPGKYTGNEVKYIKEVLESDMKSPTGVSWDRRLEEMFTEKFGAKYAVALNSGTSALHACLSAAGVGPGDEVIVPPIPVIMDALVALHTNAVPVFADVDPDTFNIDPRDIEKKITPRTKAIITVGTYGLSPDMDPIVEFAKRDNLIVIEDNCQNFLGLYKGRLTGTIGDMACYSFERTKQMSTGEGGMVITNDEGLAERVRKCGGLGYRQLGAEEGRVKLNREVFQDPDYKRFDYFGWNYRMTEVCAAMALAQLERLDELNAKRAKCAEYFKEAISGCDFMVPQKVPEGCTHSYFTFGVKYEGSEKIGVSWKEFYRVYKEMGGDGFYASCSVAYLEPLFINKSFYGKNCPIECPFYTGPKIEYRKGLCPVAESIQPKLMQFKTNYQDMKLAKRKAEALKITIEKLNKK